MSLLRQLLPFLVLVLLLSSTTSAPTLSTTTHPTKSWPSIFSKDSITNFFTDLLPTLTQKKKPTSKPKPKPKPTTSKPAPSISKTPTGGDGHGGDGEYLDALNGRATNTFILLHGLDDNAKRYSAIFKPLRFLMPSTRLIFPQADVEYVSYQKKDATSWFDIVGRKDGKGSEPKVDEEGLLKAVERVERIVKGEIERGIGKGKVIVGGLSQGGAVALTAYLRSGTRLGGAVGVSTWLPLSGDYPEMLKEGGEGKKVLLIHGEDDKVLDFRLAESAEKKLRSLKRSVELVEIKGGDHLLSNSLVKVGLKIVEFIKRNT